MLFYCGFGEDSWTARSNQSILKEISPEYSLEGQMLKLKLQYFGHLMWRTDSFGKILMLGKIEGGRRRGWDGWMASPMQRTWVWVSSGSWWGTEEPGVLQSMGSQSQTRLSNGTGTGTCREGFPSGSVVKNLPANAESMGSILGLGRSPEEGNGNPLQFSCLGNSTDSGAWQVTVHGVAKSQSQLND